MESIAEKQRSGKPQRGQSKGGMRVKVLPHLGLNAKLRKALPQELIELDQWVCYRLEWNEDRGKFDKKPVNPANGNLAQSNNPRTWGTFAQAVARVEAGKADGVGFVFTDADPYAGIDLDHCLGEEEADADGAPHKPVEPWARDIVTRLASYTEESPSGTGLHIIVRATLPPKGRKTDTVEMYESGRFFTVTGESWCISDKVEARQSEVEALHAEIFPPKEKTTQGNAQKPTQPVDLDDQQLIEKAKTAKNGAHFAKLWTGNLPGNNTHSEADLALCNMLAFWTGGDAQRVDRLFRLSGLMRPKWNVSHYADGRTYGEATVALAVEDCTEFYSPRTYRNGTGPHTEEKIPAAPSMDVTRLLSIIDELSKNEGKTAEEKGTAIRALSTEIGDLGNAEQINVRTALVTLLEWNKTDAKEFVAACRRDAKERRKATPAEVDTEEYGASWPYAVNGGRIVHLSMSTSITGDRIVTPHPVADFTATITGVVTNEEGEETYKITGYALRGGPFRCELPALDFGEPRKLAAALGAAAGPKDPILAGQAQHVGPAIKKLTGDDLTQTKRYHRTGWVGNYFLLPGREPDNSEIELHRKLPYYIAKTGDLSKGLAGLEALLKSMGPEQATVFLSTLFQAPMAKAANWRGERYAVFIAGRTGTLKTSNSQAGMGLYGPGFMNDDALTKWGEGATENALMQMATQAHDLPFLVDNYKPNTGRGARGWVGVIHNILEGGEKDRLNRAAQLKDTKPVFCWPIFTGEDVPDVDAASLARVLVIPFSEENRTPQRSAQLAIAQEAASQGHLSAVGAAWLDWLESKEGQKVATDAGARLRQTRTQWAEYLIQMRPDMVNPLRVATNLASNQLTWATVSLHPTIGPIARQYLESHRQGLTAIANEMANYTAEVLEGSRFLTGLRELLATGRGVLVMNETHEDTLTKSNAQDRIIGWTDNNKGAYLFPEIARLMVEKVIGELHISNNTLYDQLDSLGVMGRRDKNGRKTYTKRIGDKTQKVLHIISKALQDDANLPAIEE